MHYLEDAIELLEYLPEEYKKKCLELQQLDLQSTVGLEKLLKDSRGFFANLKTMSPFESEQKHKEYLEKFQTIRDMGEGKVKLAEYLQLVLEKYQERIGKDLAEFKAELEVDNPGETNLIEKNFMQSLASYGQVVGGIDTDIELQIDALRTSLSEPGLSDTAFCINGHRATTTDNDRTPTPQQRDRQFDDFRIPNNFRRASQQMDNYHLPTTSSSSIYDEDIFDAEFTPPTKKLKPAPPPRPLTLIGDVVQQPPIELQSKFTLLSGIIHIIPLTPGLPSASSSSRTGLIEGGDFAVPGQSRPVPVSTIRMPLLAASHASRHGRPRKLTKRVEQMLIGGPRPGPRANSHGRHPTTGAKRRRKREGGQDDDLEIADEEEDRYSYQDEEEYEEDEGEEEADDNRTWCICKQKSHGKMVACDNKNCPFEWFHYECVGITQEPRGEWYCPTCKMQRNSMQRSRSASSDVAH